MHYDAVVVGGGFVGCSLARSLRLSGFSVSLVEKVAQPSVDNKVFAVALDTLAWLKDDLGLGPFETGSIISIVVSHQDSARSFSLGPEDTSHPVLGYMLESAPLQTALQKEWAELPVYAPDTVSCITQEESHLCIQLASGHVFTTTLLVGADGKESDIRFLMHGQKGAQQFPQKALTFTLMTDRPQTTAYEHFFQGGSLALLPMSNNRLAAVWMDSPGAIDALVACSEDLLLSSLLSYFSKDLGITALASNRCMFPLEASWTLKRTFPRAILIGDAAQVLHPIIGQGLNLGLRQAHILSKEIILARRLGLDFGSQTCLQRAAPQRSSFILQGVTMGLVYGLSLWNSRTIWKAMTVSMRCQAWRRFIIRTASLGSV